MPSFPYHQKLRGIWGGITHITLPAPTLSPQSSSLYLEQHLEPPVCYMYQGQGTELTEARQIITLAQHHVLLLKTFATGPSRPSFAPRWTIASVRSCSGLESTWASLGAHPSLICPQTVVLEGQPHSVLRPTANIQSWIQIRFLSRVVFFGIFDIYSSVHTLLPEAAP